MDRLEFSGLLINTREAECVSKNQMCRLMGIMFTNLQRLERGNNNYNIKTIVAYLDALGYCISLSGILCCSYHDVILCIIDMRHKLQHTVRSLTALLQYSYASYSRIENERTLLNIDLFLRIVDVLGLELKIVKKL